MRGAASATAARRRLTQSDIAKTREKDQRSVGPTCVRHNDHCTNKNRAVSDRPVSGTTTIARTKTKTGRRSGHHRSEIATGESNRDQRIRHKEQRIKIKARPADESNISHGNGDSVPDQRSAQRIRPNNGITAVVCNVSADRADRADRTYAPRLEHTHTHTATDLPALPRFQQNRHAHHGQTQQPAAPRALLTRRRRQRRRLMLQY